MEEKSRQGLKESLSETLLIVKTCLTCFWFWLPSLFAAYLYLQLYLMCITPPLFIIPVLMIVPIIISIYAMLQEEKRIRARYGLDKVKLLSASAPIGSGPVKIDGNRLKVEELVEEYKQMLKRKKKEKQKIHGEP